MRALRVYAEHSACWLFGGDVGSRPTPRCELGRLVLIPAATETDPSQPVVRQGHRRRVRCKKGAARFPQAGDNLWKTSYRKSILGESSVWFEGSLSMEGTLGAADLGSLRGESGEAALGSGWCWSARAG